MIHRFKLNNNYFILDSPSGSIHIVAPVVYDIVEDSRELSLDAIVEKYSSLYKEEEIREAYAGISGLVEEELLFTEDIQVPIEDFNPDYHIKALCLHVAHDCNLRCKYCFASQGDFHGERSIMDLDTGKKAFDFLLENSGNRRNLEVDFFGGEPLMNFPLVKELVAYGKSKEEEYNKHFRFTITTNGVLLNDETIDFINKEMDNVVLSLDGRKDVNDSMRPTVSEKGSFDIIIPKYQRLISSRGDKDYYIRGTFTNHNLDFSKDVLLYRELGFENTSMEPVVTDPTEEYAIREEHLEKILEEYEKLSKEYIEIRKDNPNFSFFHFIMDLEGGPCAYKKATGCGAGTDYIAVTPEGDIYPCHQFVGEEKYCLGNLDAGIINRNLQDTFQKANIYTKVACSSCWAKYYCSGGCHANAYYNNGSIEEPFSLGCEMEKKRIECSISVYSNEMVKS